MKKTTKKDFKREVKVGNKLIRLCRNIYITLGELNWSILNRDKLKKHVETLGRSIQDHGLLKSIPVLPVNKDGKRNPIDDNHGFTSMIDYIGLPLDTVVPASEVWWVDPDDNRAVQECIMTLNNNVKNWKLDQVVVSYSRTVAGIYETIRQKLRLYKNLSTSTVVNAYCVPNMRKVAGFKTGYFDLYWTSNNERWREAFIIATLNKMSNFVKTYNQPNIKRVKIDASWSREVVARLMADAATDKNMTRWRYLLNAAFQEARVEIRKHGYLPIKDAFDKYWDDVKITASEQQSLNKAA